MDTTDKTKLPIDLQSSDITPITHQKIEKVSPNQWSNMSTDQLFKELSILIQRRDVMMEMGKTDAARQITFGIETIQQLINSRNINPMEFF